MAALQYMREVKNMSIADVFRCSHLLGMIPVICLNILLIALAISDYRKRTVSTAMVMLTNVMSTGMLLSEVIVGKESLAEHFIAILPGLFFCAYSYIRPEEAGNADGLVMICIAEISRPSSYIVTMALTAFFTLICGFASSKKQVKLPFISILVGAYLICGRL